MVAKLSSVRIMSPASFDTSVPVMPIAMPMSAFFRAGASLTPSPVMATIAPLRLQRVDEPHLVFGRDPGEHADLVDLRSRLLVAHRVEIGAGDRSALDSQLPGDRRCRDGVVAGDHPHLDPRGLRLRDRILGGGARRVDDADEGQHRQLLHVAEQVGVRIEAVRIEVAPRRCQHAQPLLAEPLVLGLVAFLHRVVDRDRAQVVRGQGRGRAGEHLVRRAFHEAADDVVFVLVLHPVEGRHQLVVGVEWQRRDRGEVGPRGLGVEPALRGEDDEGALGRVADHLAVADHRVGREDHRHQELVERDVRLAGRRERSAPRSSSPSR